MSFRDYLEDLFKIFNNEVGVSKEDILGRNRSAKYVACRRIIANELRSKQHTLCSVADILNRGHSSIIYYVQSF